MMFKKILIVAIWKSRQTFRAYGRGNMSLEAVKLPISHNNVAGENTVLQLNILETGGDIGGYLRRRYMPVCISEKDPNT